MSCLMGTEGTRIGEKQGGSFVYAFRHVRPNKSGVVTGGSESLFQDKSAEDADEDQFIYEVPPPTDAPIKAARLPPPPTEEAHKATLPPPSPNLEAPRPKAYQA